MKKPYCKEHKFEIIMHRNYVRIKQKWIAIGWVCLYCGASTIDDDTTFMDKNQKSILEFEKDKVDK